MSTNGVAYYACTYMHHHNPMDCRLSYKCTSQLHGSYKPCIKPNIAYNAHSDEKVIGLMEEDRRCYQGKIDVLKYNIHRRTANNNFRA